MTSKMNFKILIVEDEDESQKVFRRMLNDYNIHFCISEKTMYEQLVKTNYNLILMDIGLAGSKDGLEIIKDLKTNQLYNGIPIICITSHVYNQQKIDALNAGADQYITKPLSKTLLIQTIEKCLI